MEAFVYQYGPKLGDYVIWYASWYSSVNTGWCWYKALSSWLGCLATHGGHGYHIHIGKLTPNRFNWKRFYLEDEDELQRIVIQSVNDAALPQGCPMAIKHVRACESRSTTKAALS